MHPVGSHFFKKKRTSRRIRRRGSLRHTRSMPTPTPRCSGRASVLFVPSVRLQRLFGIGLLSPPTGPSGSFLSSTPRMRFRCCGDRSLRHNWVGIGLHGSALRFGFVFTGGTATAAERCHRSCDELCGQPRASSMSLLPCAGPASSHARSVVASSWLSLVLP